ncbi:MAG TPA: transposase, partial [Polyangiaceae bacterium]
LRLALAKATRARTDFRVVQFSVQRDHLHLIIEASGNTALSRGMQGLAIRIARQLNRLLGRTGKLWADRFFSRVLRSPRVVRSALAYVLDNFRKHRESRMGIVARIDPYSSAPYFSGFRELGGRTPWELAASPAWPLSPRGVQPPKTRSELPVLRARTWLALHGWRKGGALTTNHVASIDSH